MADDDDSSGSPGEAAFVGIVLLVMFICLFIGWKTPETVVFMSLVLVWNTGLVSTTEALSGFSNTGMLAVGALFVVVKGVEKSQLADKAARRVFGLQTSLRSGLLRLMVLCFVLSAFLNNTPVVALLIPITRDWARTRGFSPSIFLIPLSYSCIFGGLITIIGTSTNLVVQGLIADESANDPTVEKLGFFEPGYIGLPMGIIGMGYLVVAAPHILPATGGLFRYVRDRAKELLTEVQVMKDFPHTGEPVGLVLARLGLPHDTLIKIRRLVKSHILRAMSNSLQEHGSISLAGPNSGEAGAETLENQPTTLTCTNMYEYRERSESLWGRKGDVDQTPSSKKVPLNKMFQAPSKMEDSDTAPISNDTAVVTAANSSEGGLRRRLGDGTECSEGDNGGRLHKKVLSGDHRGTGTPIQTIVDNGNTEESQQSGVYTDIYPVSAAEPIHEGDILFLSCAQNTMIDFQATTVSQGLEGLKFLDVSALDLPGQGTEFFELVLSDKNHFVGRYVGRDNTAFAQYYSCSVVAVRRVGSSDATSASVATVGQSSTVASVATSRVADAAEVHLEEGMISADAALAPPTGPSPRAVRQRTMSPQRSLRRNRERSGTVEDIKGVEVGKRTFKAGDVVLVLAHKEFMDKFSSSKDFFLVTKVGQVPQAVQLYDYLPLLAFLGMLLWVLISGVDMVQAAFAAGAILIFGGWVDAKKAVGYVDWSLLLLIGSALGLSKAIVNSGLADYAGGAIRDSGISAQGSIFLLYAFTALCTELITNNAAAALAVPIAFSISRELEVSYKPLVVTVMMAASSSFLTPIGYQTNTLVWGPGGYKFTDFMKIGSPLSLVYLVLGSLLVPMIFPF